MRPGFRYQLLMVFLSVVFLAACQEDNPVIHDYGFVFSVDGDNVVVTYDEQPPDLRFLMNNYDVTENFTIGSKQATASLSDIEYVIQGNNNLEARHGRGKATHAFVYDSEGPEIFVTDVNCSGVRCLEEDGELKTISGVFEDISDIESLTVTANVYRANLAPPYSDYDDEGFPVSAIGDQIDQQVAEINNEDKTFTVNIHHGGIFTFEAVDSFGNETEMKILANGSALNPIFKLRLGNSAMTSLGPVLGDALTHMNMNGIDPESDTYSAILRDFSITHKGDFSEEASTQVSCDYNEPGGILIPSGWEENCQFDGVEGETVQFYIGEIMMDSTTVNELAVNDSETDTLQMDMSIVDDPEHDATGTWGMQVAMRAKVHECKHDLYSERHQGKTYWFTNGLVCEETDKDGMLSMLYSDEPAADGNRYATLRMDETHLAGPIGVHIENGILATDVTNMDFNFEGLDSDEDILGIPIEALTPIIEELVGPLIQTTLNNALQSFYLPLVFTSVDNGTQFSLIPAAFQVFTETAAVAPNEANMHMNYVGIMQTNVQSLIDAGFTPEDIPPVLGSYYVEQNMPKPETGPAGDNLEISLNSNFLNQALLTMYNTGLMHIQMVNGAIYFGPKVSDNMGEEGDTRIRLIPNGPATLKLEKTEDNDNLASIQWEKAELRMEKKKDGNWKQTIGLDVDFKAYVDLYAEDDKLYVNLNEPEMITNRVMLGDTENSIELIRWLVDEVAAMILPKIAEQTIEIPFPDIETSDGSVVTMDLVDFDTLEGGHMNIKMKIDKIDQNSL